MSTAQVTISDAVIKRYATHDVATLHDQQLRPLYFRYHQGRASGTWYLVGRQFPERWRKIGRWPEVSVSVVRKEAPKLLVSGTDEHSRIDTGKTLGEVLMWYRDRTLQNRGIKPERRADVVGIIKNHLLPRHGLTSLKLPNIRRHHIDSELMLPLQAYLKPATMTKVFHVLKAATKAASALDVIGADPLGAYRFADFIKRGATAKPGALRADDITRILDQILAGQPRASMLALLILMSGTRIGESSAARVGDFDFDADWWHIPASRTKTNQAFRVPLTPVSRPLIRQYIRNHTKPHQTALFAGRSGPWQRAYSQRAIKSLTDNTWSSHDLRKLARTVWADQGVDYMVCELLLNHRMSKLDQTYIHTYADEQRRNALTEYHQWLMEHEGFSRLVRYAQEEESRLTNKEADN